MNYKSTPIVESGESSVLDRIHSGMAVYDRQNEHIGKVAFVYLGTASSKERERGEGPARDSGSLEAGDDSFVEVLANVFNPEEIPGEVAEKLRQHGYIRIDSNGLFAYDRFAATEQILSVANDEVHLNVGYKQLATSE